MLIETSEIREYLQVSEDISDDFLTLLLGKSIGYIEGYIGYEIDSFSKTKIISGNNTKIYFDFYKNISISEISKNIGNDFSPVWEAITSEEYFFDSDKCIFHFKKCLNLKQAYKINFSAGYNSTNIPKDLKNAILNLLSYFYLQSGKNGDVKSETVDWDKIEFGKIDQKEMLENINLILDKYKFYGIYS